MAIQRDDHGWYPIDEHRRHNIGDWDYTKEKERHTQKERERERERETEEEREREYRPHGANDTILRGTSTIEWKLDSFGFFPSP
mmetsp:Transcript_25320/g.27161  ORF Transcript_25320/g.27161 Transcript_25320/m.27161 type:complete len:84 (-) Transcript_25320:39-290(-)